MVAGFIHRDSWNCCAQVQLMTHQLIIRYLNIYKYYQFVCGNKQIFFKHLDSIQVIGIYFDAIILPIIHLIADGIEYLIDHTLSGIITEVWDVLDSILECPSSDMWNGKRPYNIFCFRLPIGWIPTLLNNASTHMRYQIH